MLLATDATGQVRTPIETGERGKCPGCEASVLSKVGLIVRPHWAHFGRSECDSWAGGETDWHLGWKQLALEAGWSVERSMREGEVLHRADAVSDRGHVVEFQHSRLNVPELRERSDFYGTRGVLCWVLDGSVSGWRRIWWEWTKQRTEPPPGVRYVAIDEIGATLRSKRGDLIGAHVWLWEVER